MSLVDDDDDSLDEIQNSEDENEEDENGGCVSLTLSNVDFKLKSQLGRICLISSRSFKVGLFVLKDLLLLTETQSERRRQRRPVWIRSKIKKQPFTHKHDKTHTTPRKMEMTICKSVNILFVTFFDNYTGSAIKRWIKWAIWRAKKHRIRSISKIFCRSIMQTMYDLTLTEQYLFMLTTEASGIHSITSRHVPDSTARPSSPKNGRNWCCEQRVYVELSDPSLK